jgi:hypothetical protein
MISLIKSQSATILLEFISLESTAARSINARSVENVVCIFSFSGTRVLNSNLIAFRIPESAPLKALGTAEN